MPADQTAARMGHRLLQLGTLLFLIGLVIGLTVGALANPRMGMASHVEAVMNGLFLIALGLMWPRMVMTPGRQALTFGLAVYGTFANVLATFLAALWGAGASMMPIAGQGHSGGLGQETLIQVLLVSLSLAMIAVCGLVLSGLRARH